MDLDIELSVVIVKYDLSFRSHISTFRQALKELFNKEYNDDEIENCLIKMEEDILCMRKVDVVEIPDDYYLE